MVCLMCGVASIHDSDIHVSPQYSSSFLSPAFSSLLSSDTDCRVHVDLVLEELWRPDFLTFDDYTEHANQVGPLLVK